MFLRHQWTCRIAALAVIFALASTVSADPFTIGNLAVVRVANGSNAASVVNILEIQATSSSASVVQPLALPSTGTTALTLQGTSTTEGTLSRSSDGRYLTLGGYRKDAGGTNPTADTAATTNRVIGRIELATGAVDTSTALTDAYNSISIRSAATNDGTQFWTSGANGTGGGLRYVASVGATSSTALGATTRNLRQTQVIGGNLFTTAGANNPGRSVFQVGTGLPTSGDPTFNASFTPVAAGEGGYNSFYFTRLGNGTTWSNTDFDTLYAVNSDLGRLDKFSFDGGAWGLENSVALAGIFNVAGTTNGSSVTLYVTTTASTGSLQTLTDTSGFNANNNGSFLSLLDAGSGFAFRGIAIVPEPGSMLLCSLAGVGFAGAAIRRYRKRAATA